MTHPLPQDFATVASTKGKFLVSRDLVFPGSKGQKEFFVFDSAEHHRLESQKRPQSKRNDYEITSDLANHNRKFYTDIDAPLEETESQDMETERERFLTYAKQRITEGFLKHKQIQLKDSDFRVGDSCSRKKISLHVLVHGYHFGMDPRVIYDLRRLFFPGRGRGRKNQHLNNDNPLDQFFDEAPYSTRQSFRLIGSCKAKDPDRIMHPFVNGKRVDVRDLSQSEYESYLVTAGDDCQFVPHEKQFDKENKSSYRARKENSTIRLSIDHEELLEQMDRYSKEKCQDSWEYDHQQGNQYFLRSKTGSGFCPLCVKVHNTQRPWFSFHENTGKLFFHCFNQGVGAKADFVWELPVPFMRTGMDLHKYRLGCLAALETYKQDGDEAKLIGTWRRLAFQTFRYHKNKLLKKSDDGGVELLPMTACRDEGGDYEYTPTGEKRKRKLELRKLLGQNPEFLVNELVCKQYVDKDPYANQPGVINTFAGFQGQILDEVLPVADEFVQGTSLPPYPQELSVWMRHFREVSCNDEAISMDYLLKYLKFIIFSGKRPQVALLFYAPTGGEGKTTPFEFLQRFVLGDAISESTNVGELLNFNYFLHKRTYVFINEFDSSNKYSDVDKFKTMITDHKLKLNGKYMPHLSIDNNHSFLLATNHKRAFPALSAVFRRIFQLFVSDKYIGNVAYFDNLYKKGMTQRMGDLFMTYLSQIDISDFNPMKIPKCSSREAQAEEIRTRVDQFMSSVIAAADPEFDSFQKPRRAVDGDDDKEDEELKVPLDYENAHMEDVIKAAGMELQVTLQDLVVVTNKKYIIPDINTLWQVYRSCCEKKGFGPGNFNGFTDDLEIIHFRKRTVDVPVCGKFPLGKKGAKLFWAAR